MTEQHPERRDAAQAVQTLDAPNVLYLSPQTFIGAPGDRRLAARNPLESARRPPGAMKRAALCALQQIGVVRVLPKRICASNSNEDRKGTRLNSSHSCAPRMPSSA